MNTSLDRKKLVGVIAQKLNILISEDDPIFATVILNELVLTEFIDVASNELAGILVLIKNVETSLSRSTNEAVSRLNAQAEKILNAIDELSDQAIEADNLRLINIEAAAKRSADAAIQDSYRRVSEIMEPMIMRVTHDMEQSMASLEKSYKAIQNLHNSAAIAVVESINKAVRIMKYQRDRTILYCMISSMLGSAIACGIAMTLFR